MLPHALAALVCVQPSHHGAAGAANAAALAAAASPRNPRADPTLPHSVPPHPAPPRPPRCFSLAPSPAALKPLILFSAPVVHTMWKLEWEGAQGSMGTAQSSQKPAGGRAGGQAGRAAWRRENSCRKGIDAPRSSSTLNAARCAVPRPAHAAAAAAPAAQRPGQEDSKKILWNLQGSGNLTHAVVLRHGVKAGEVAARQRPARRLLALRHTQQKCSGKRKSFLSAR